MTAPSASTVGIIENTVGPSSPLPHACSGPHGETTRTPASAAAIDGRPSEVEFAGDHQQVGAGLDELGRLGVDDRHPSRSC